LDGLVFIIIYNYLLAHDNKLISFNITIGESRLNIKAKKNLRDEATRLLLENREIIERYIRLYKVFQTSLKPISQNKNAPSIIQKMTDAGIKMGVGPMAAVAGAIAQEVAMGLYKYSTELIVENGGDIFLISKSSRYIEIDAGLSILNKKLALEIEPAPNGISVCTSSGTVGHSLSFGCADAAIVISSSAYLADAAATAVCNTIRSEANLVDGIELAKSTKGILGALVIKDDKMSAWGKIKLVPNGY